MAPILLVKIPTNKRWKKEQTLRIKRTSSPLKRVIKLRFFLPSFPTLYCVGNRCNLTFF